MRYFDNLAEVFVKYVIWPGIVLFGLWLQKKIGDKRERERKHRQYNFTPVKDAGIEQTLAELRGILFCDRAYVAMYHNGNKYIDGSDDIKVSRTHEIVAQGVTYEAQNWQDIRVGLIKDEKTLVTAPGAAWHPIVELPDGRFRRALESQGVKGVARCAIMRDDDLIGYVGVDFDHETKPAEIERVCNAARRIEQIISKYR